MSSKDTEKKTKTSLMDELKSIKGVLNADDDNIPLLLDDEQAADDNIPVLAGDDDIPVLTSPDELNANKASLDAAIRQLESMELSPKSNKSRPDKTAKPDDKATMVRENPFIAKNPTDRFAESRKQAEEALKSVISHSRAISQATRPPAPAVAEKPIEFTAEAAAAKVVKPAPAGADDDENASADILKLLDEEPEVQLDLGDDFDELVDIDVDALINEKTAAAKTSPKTSPPVKKTDAQIDAVINEVIEEYMIILEAALKKKLKEKLPDLLKK
jgi:hypothetical protein